MPTELTPREQELVDLKSQIEELLRTKNAALVPVTLISGQRVLSRVDVVPLESFNNNAQQAPAAA